MAGRFVKQEYHDEDVPEKSVDVEIAIDLKTRGRAFLVEKYKHSYPHCWRTDRPILYYPLGQLVHPRHCRQGPDAGAQCDHSVEARGHRVGSLWQSGSRT